MSIVGGEHAQSGFASTFPSRFCFACGNFKAREGDESQTNFHYAAGGYSRPPLWKRLLRKLKAESKQVHVACCLHLYPHETISHQYTALSYQNNFDQGHFHHHSLQHSVPNAWLLGEDMKSEDVWKNLESSMSESGSKTSPTYPL